MEIEKVRIEKVRMPLCAEWTGLATVTNCENPRMHWALMTSWCQETDLRCPDNRMVGGMNGASTLDSLPADSRYINVGFRPVFEGQNLDMLGPNGSTVIAGTLYMDGHPVRVPTNPILDGDIPNYVFGTKLEFREALDDPAYQVQAIVVGDVLIADRVLLVNISWCDIVECFGAVEPGVAACKLSTLKELLEENDENLSDPSDTYARGYHDAIVDVMRKLGFSSDEIVNGGDIKNKTINQIKVDEIMTVKEIIESNKDKCESVEIRSESFGYVGYWPTRPCNFLDKNHKYTDTIANLKTKDHKILNGTLRIYTE